MHTMLTLQLTYYDNIYSNLISECNETACLVFVIVYTFKIKLNNLRCIKKNFTFTIPNGKNTWHMVPFTLQWAQAVVEPGTRVIQWHLPTASG